MQTANTDITPATVKPVTPVQGTTLTLDGQDATNRTIILSQGGRLIVNGIIPDSLSIEFTDGTGTLVINDSQHFDAAVSGFGKGDAIVFAEEFGTLAKYGDGRVTVLTGTDGTVIADFKLDRHTGLHASDLFLSRDGNGNSVLVRSTQRNWTGGNGDWYSAANWTATDGSPGSPGTGDTAVIGSGTVSVTSGGMTMLNNALIELTGSDATLRIADGTLGAGLTIEASATGTPSHPTLSLLGQTTLDGVIGVAPRSVAADLHLVVGDGGTGTAGLLTVSSRGVIGVAPLGTLHIDAGVVRDDGLIAVSGRLALEAGASLDGSGTVSVGNGTFEAKGRVGSGLHVDLGGSGDFGYGQAHSTLTLKDLPGFGGVIDDFGAGDRIDVEGIKVRSVAFDAGTGTLHLLDGTGNDLGTLRISGAHEAADFRLSTDRHGGTFIKGRAGTDALDRVATTFLPTAAHVAIGGGVTLQQLLVDAFGSDVSQKLGEVLVSSTSGSDLGWASYWNLAAPTVATWTTGGAAVPADTVRTIAAADWSNTVLTAGSAIQATAQVLLPSAWSNGTVTAYTAYNIETVDPALVRAGTAAPTAADIVEAANTLNRVYAGTPNSEDCYNIAAQVGAAAGATFSSMMYSTDPHENRAGGYWRVAYSASDSANPVSNWSSLVQAGDVLRIGWSPKDDPHSFTIMQGLHDGRITVLDNVYSTPGLSNEDETQIGIHDVDYWTQTDPAAISIFRLDPNGKFLVLGSALMGGNAVNGETLRGSGTNDLFIPGEHATTLVLGGGTDMIADKAENLDGSTVEGLANGDSIDITDMASPGATASYDSVSGTLVVRAGARSVTIGLDKGLTGQFTLAADGGRQGLDGGTLGDIYDSLYTAGPEGLRLTFHATAPRAPAVSLPGGQGGAIDLDALRLDGTGEAGTTISATLGSQVVGTAVVGSGGRWSLVLSSAVPLGSSTLSLTETNGAGASSAAATLAVSRDASGSAIQLAAGGEVVAATYGTDGRLAALTGGSVGQTAETDAAALFDPAWYLAQNPDVAAAGVDPYQHFLQFGWHEGRSPSALFSTAFYLNQNPDVAAASVDPLLHYATFGWHENRDPSSLFSTAGYLALHPGVAGLGLDPLLHYEEIGKAEGLATQAATPHPTGPQDPLVDAATLYAQRPDLVAAGLDATGWYVANGATTPVNPDPLFDAALYLQQNPDVAAAGINPLLHYEVNGWHENRDPSLLFSNSQYLQANPDVAAAGMNPLQHYLVFGQHEGRMAFLSGGSAAADPLVDPTYYDKQLGATLLPSGTTASMQAAASYDATGWKQGLNPDTLFDTSYYLSHNPDVAAAGLNPLLHYEQWGWHEGRDASAAFDTNAYLQHNPDVAAAGMDPLVHYVVFGAAEGRAIYAVS